MMSFARRYLNEFLDMNVYSESTRSRIPRAQIIWWNWSQIKESRFPRQLLLHHTLR